MRSLRLEFTLYLAVSMIALGVDVGVLYALVLWTAMAKPLAGALAYAAGLVVHYELAVSKVFVFRRYLGKRPIEFALYAITGAAGIAISAGIIWIGTWLDASLWASKAVAVAVSFVVTYLVRRRALFTRSAATRVEST